MATQPLVKFKDVVVDCTDPALVARFWHEVLGGELNGPDDGYYWLDGAHGTGFESIDFVPVPEAKTVKNRVHWDVWLSEGVTLDDLVAKGASVVGEQERWTTMADPEGNEFCVFATPPSA